MGGIAVDGDVIRGVYPCCGTTYITTVPPYAPVYSVEKCPMCGVKVRHLLSLTDPKIFTEEEFRKLYSVDKKTGRISPREDK